MNKEEYDRLSKKYYNLPTDNYIKMCEQSDEIQKLRGYKRGEWYYTKKHRTDVTNGFHIICNDWDFFLKDDRYIKSDRKDNWITRAKGVWLPTQEELQGMVLPTLKKKYNKAWDLEKINRQANWIFRIFNCFLNEHSRIYSNDMNELWLVFVMYEKYNKVWNGDKWRKAVKE